LNANEEGYEIRREGEVNYSKPIARALLRDIRLTFGARGVFAWLWDLPHGWRANSAHIASQSPQGKDAVKTILRQLEAVGAMRVEVIRGEGGKLAGKRWVLVSPDRWAVEAPLSSKSTPEPEATPGATSTEGRVFRPSVKPTIGKPATKVLLDKGSSILRTTTNQNQKPVVVVANVLAEGLDPRLVTHHHSDVEPNEAVINDLVEAAVWGARRGREPLRNEPNFRRSKRLKLEDFGPSEEDLQLLSAWRESGRRAAQQAELASKQVEDRKKPPVLDREACVKGAGFFKRPGGVQEKIKLSGAIPSCQP